MFYIFKNDDSDFPISQNSSKKLQTFYSNDPTKIPPAIDHSFSTDSEA